MKYEVAGDTIIIKYIADGKYKKLELNKNDEIDLDFFGQLINAKNNKQDAMCDLYAKEVLTYEPPQERITNMNLTKPDEPSEYTKKEAAKLRIEELTRDLKSTEKEIQSMLLRQYQDKKIDDLKDDYLKDRSQTNIDRLYDLIDKYNTIKQSIEKEQKIYDSINKRDNYTQDALIKKITNEFENKISKVVENSDERKELMDNIIESLNPSDQLKQEIDQTNQIIDELADKLNEVKTSIIDKKIETKKGLKEKEEDEIELNDDELEEMVKEVFKDKFVTNLFNTLTEHIEIIINLLQKTDIENKIIKDLQEINDKLKNIEPDKLADNIIILKQILEAITKINNEKKINYTQKTINTVVNGTNKLLLEHQRIDLLFKTKITPKFINDLIENLKKNTENSLNTITFQRGTSLNREELKKVMVSAPNILLWKQDKDPKHIYSNINFVDIFEPAILTYKTVEYNCYRISTDKLLTYNFSIFRNYITTNKTKFKIPSQVTDLYLDLEPNIQQRTLIIGGSEKTFTYWGYSLKQTSMSNIIKIISGFGEGMKVNNEGGKIDLDKATTEEKLSEIIRLLQNIGYNLFTLTPNYEESEKNKRLKSKGVRSKNSAEGVDLKELFG